MVIIMKSMANKEKGNTVSVVWQIAQPIAESLGLSLWDVRFVKEGADWFLRIFIDKQDGVSIEDCEAMSRAIDQPLDDADPIRQAYCLEVSSPGVERELVRPEHFAQMTGQPVVVKLIRPDENGERELCATLGGLEEDEIILLGEDDAERRVAVKDAAWVKLDDF